jgi:hypothetical protein
VPSGADRGDGVFPPGTGGRELSIVVGVCMEAALADLLDVSPDVGP